MDPNAPAAVPAPNPQPLNQPIPAPRPMPAPAPTPVQSPATGGNPALDTQATPPQAVPRLTPGVMPRPIPAPTPNVAPRPAPVFPPTPAPPPSALPQPAPLPIPNPQPLNQPIPVPAQNVAPRSAPEVVSQPAPRPAGMPPIQMPKPEAPAVANLSNQTLAAVNVSKPVNPVAQALSAGVSAAPDLLNPNVSADQLAALEPASNSRIWSQKFIIALVVFVIFAIAGGLMLFRWLEL